MSIQKKRFNVYNMTCTSCENPVEKSIKKLTGVENAKADYSKQIVEVLYDDSYCNGEKICEAIEKAGYTVQKPKSFTFIGILIIVAAIVILGFNTSGFDMEEKLNAGSYAVIFMVGVLTSIHCVGMCGGIMLSQSLGKESQSKFDAIKPALLYNLGRVISYTLLGGIVGALGSVFSLSLTAQAVMQILAGVFMLIMGLNMTGFSLFRKINLKLPYSACKFKHKFKSSFVVGILNGLMPCGPLQTMQLFALASGSASKGALSMFLFSIGTVPLMLTFGALSGLLSKNYTKNILKFSGVLVMALGLIMGSRGLILAGVNIHPMKSTTSSVASSKENSTDSSKKSGSNKNSNTNKNNSAVVENGVQTITMTANNRGYSPNVLYIQKGIPVKWIIKGEQLNSCNNAVVSKALNLQKKLQKGENVIEFTPGNEDINFSCWMGMISGVIKVVDNLDTTAESNTSSTSTTSTTVAGNKTPSCCQVE